MTTTQGLPATDPIEAMTRSEKSTLLYAESCAVDGSGLLAGVRMNAGDIDALQKFKAGGLLDFGRIPSHAIDSLIHPGGGVRLTHWVSFNEAGWAAAHALRRERASQVSSNRRKVNEALDQRTA